MRTQITVCHAEVFAGTSLVDKGQKNEPDLQGRSHPRPDKSGKEEHTAVPAYCVYLKLLMYMYRVGPIVAVPPQVELFVPQILNRK